MTPLLSQIVRLTKNILLQVEGPARRPSVQFFAGKQRPFHFSGGLGLSWWYSNDTFQAIENVSLLLIESASEFKDCDLESVSDAVTTTLQEICLDSSIFDGDAVFLRRNRSLFDCRVVPVPQFAAAIQTEMESSLRRRIGHRCVLYAVPRFQVPSFSLDDDAVRLIKRDDEKAWDQLIEKGYRFNGWTPLRPQFGNDRDLTFAPPGNFECIFVAEEYGTPKGARFSGILRFRKLAAILFAIASESSDGPFFKAMSHPYEFLIHFPHQLSKEAQITRTDSDPVVPFYVADIPVSSKEVLLIQNWYAASARCSSSDRSRIEKSSHFFNRGMNSNDVEAYVNYFVSLDAMFGERGSVEKSILRGLRELKLPSALVEKATWLFDLRNEIVHGGSRFISEWSRFGRYRQHFQTQPADDVRLLAQTVLLRAPYLFS